MENSLFDNLKDLKKELAANEKKESIKKEDVIKQKKEQALKVDFEAFMKSSGIKKIN